MAHNAVPAGTCGTQLDAVPERRGVIAEDQEPLARAFSQVERCGEFVFPGGSRS